jgi:hypothetical protein
MARSWSGLRKLWPAVVGFGALALAWLVWQLSTGGAALGGYQVVADASYSFWGAAKYVVFHIADLLILCGVIPALGVAALLVRAIRRGEPDPRVRAYLAVTAGISAWFVLQVGIFASQYSNRIVERNLMALAPLLFVGLVLWLERGAPRSYVVAGVAAVVLLVLPVKRLVSSYTTHDAMTTIPLYRLAQWTSGGTMRIVYWVVAAALVALFAFGPRRVVRWTPTLLIVAAVLASVQASRFVVDQAALQQRTFLGPDPRWVDHSGAKRVAYLYDGEPSWNGVWQTVFFNRKIERVLNLGTPVPGPLPQDAAQIRPDGMVVDESKKRKPRWAVASTWMQLHGDLATQIEQPGLTQRGLALWHLSGPLQVLSQISGVHVNGDIYGPDVGRLEAFDCHKGVFRYTLLIKEDEAIDIRLDGKLLRHLDLKGGQVWTSSVPVDRKGATCTLEIAPTRLVGTTVLEFDRSG